MKPHYKCIGKQLHRPLTLSGVGGGLEVGSVVLSPISEPDRVHHHPSVMPPPHTPVACQRPDRDGKPFILLRWEMNAWLDIDRGQLLLSGR
ncbi:hypothetical protein CEXT_18701 [Caerostris extrusa]|uniref:Uncharacterized protein n=1 Tax=Caerostris extrusa TaxID=172846 RepID=A0AAV4Q3Z9_CAEEX|nr:hypothetical protein CEXT_18701 [Caerostris extrusa]